MRKKNRMTRFLTFSLIGASILCVCIFGFLIKYINQQSSTTVNELGNIYMSSMNERISKHFETMVELRMTQLETTVKTIPMKYESDSEALREWLESSARARDFEALAYYFDDGSFEMIYGEEAKSLNPEMFFESMKNGERKISVGIGEDEEKSAVLGVPFSMKMADGREVLRI